MAVSDGDRQPRPLLLVLRALGLGDLLTGVPALRALRAAFPEHRLVLATPPALAALAFHTGAIDAVLAAAPLAPLHARLARPDVAVNLHGSGPESHGVLLATRPRRLIAFRHAGVAASAEGPAWDADEHETARWCRLLVAAGIEADPTRLEIAAPCRPVPSFAHGATILHPGAKDPARRWPPERWVAVARAEAAAGRMVVITGDAGERLLGCVIATRAGLPASRVLAGTTDLVGLAALVAASARVVCGDTGIAHLATALRKPSVVLFGPVAPAQWGPPADRTWHRALWKGRRGDPHGSAPDPGLLEITVDEVLHALAELPPAPGSLAVERERSRA